MLEKLQEAQALTWATYQELKVEKEILNLATPIKFLRDARHKLSETAYIGGCVTEGFDVEDFRMTQIKFEASAALIKLLMALGRDGASTAYLYPPLPKHSDFVPFDYIMDYILENINSAIRECRSGNKFHLDVWIAIYDLVRLLPDSLGNLPHRLATLVKYHGRNHHPTAHPYHEKWENILGIPMGATQKWISF